MKRKTIILLLIALLLSVSSLYAGSEAGVDFHLDGGLAFVRGSQMAPLVGFSIGLESKVYGVEAYVLGEMMLQPGGSTTGQNVTSELMPEAGLRFLWRLFASESTISHFSIDVGYFTQWLKTPSSTTGYYLMHNGVMVRPGISTIMCKGKLYQVELGVYYQKTLLPAYTDYDGVVVMIKLF